MRQTQNFSGFVHSQAYVKTIACLVLACGGALPTLAASETLSSPKVENVQQNGITVKGVVKDTNGEPIIGATVMERRYPAFGNLVPRDVASRAAKERCDKGFGVNNTGLAK